MDKRNTATTLNHSETKKFQQLKTHFIFCDTVKTFLLSVALHWGSFPALLVRLCVQWRMRGSYHQLHSGSRRSSYLSLLHCPIAAWHVRFYWEKKKQSKPHICWHLETAVHVSLVRDCEHRGGCSMEQSCCDSWQWCTGCENALHRDRCLKILWLSLNGKISGSSSIVRKKINCVN